MVDASIEPRIRVSLSRKPKPTVTNTRISLGTATPGACVSGGLTCGPITHSFVITP